MSITQQIAELRKRLQFLLDNGRDGTTAVKSVRQMIVDLEAQAEQDKVRNHNPLCADVNTVAAPRQAATAKATEEAVAAGFANVDAYHFHLRALEQKAKGQ